MSEPTEMHPALLELFDALAREEGLIDGGLNWVRFLSADAEIVANFMEGQSRVRIRAYLLNDDDTLPSDDEVLSWVDAQPRPRTGIVEAARDDETERLTPRLVFERPVAGFTTTHLEDDIFTYAEAWENRSTAPLLPTVELEQGDPVSLAPQNAWLLVGDEASYPTPEDLDEDRADGAVGIFNTLWTAPKHGEVGDLVLVYFVRPRKAVCFVARLASRPFWRADITVNADRPVDNHQWWAYLTPLVEVEPIDYSTLAAANNEFLLLRGRGGHYLNPGMIQQLRFQPAQPDHEAELRAVTMTPRGHAQLPDPATMTFTDWRSIPNGLLPLEAKVSEYVLRPLVRFVGGVDRVPRIVPTLLAEHRTAAGVVDFVICAGDTPLIAVEVKLATRHPSSGVWAESPDFRQLTRYMDALDTPGLLVDAHSIVIVHRNGTPGQEIVRAGATPEDIEQLQELLFGRCTLCSAAQAESRTPQLGPRPPLLRRG